MVGEKHRMRFSLFLLAALLAGCSAASNPKTATPGAPPGETRPAATANGAAPVDTAAPAATATAEAVKAGGIKVNPPKLPVGPVAGGPTPTLPPGWQTYISFPLHLAVGYPKDWSVTEESAGARFTSPQGVTIILEGDQSPPTASPTQDCADLINDYGQAGEACFDAAASRYSAVFDMVSGVMAPWVVLSTTSAEKPVVYLQMLDSLRSLPLMEKP